MRTKVGPIEALDVLDSTGGAPLQLGLDTIDEDPAQPRVEYDEAALRELAETIKRRGVRQPISVRPHPDEPGRWLLNFGSRRLRASRLAGVEQIPAFIDSTVDAYDQVIENEQRENLQPMELARFVAQELRAGRSRTQIARDLGKSSAYVTYLCALIDPPVWLSSLYRDGRCRGIKELYDLRRLQESHPEEVSGWLGSVSHVSRGAVEELQERLEARTTAGYQASSEARPPIETSPAGPARPNSQANPSTSPPTPRSRSMGTPSSVRRIVLLADFRGETVAVLLDPVPKVSDEVFVTSPGDTLERAVPVSGLSKLRLCRAGGGPS